MNCEDHRRLKLGAREPWWGSPTNNLFFAKHSKFAKHCEKMILGVGPNIVNMLPNLWLQDTGGLFWHGHHPKMYEMVSDGSSRADLWTDLWEMLMRFFCSFGKHRTNDIVVQQNTRLLLFLTTNLWEAAMCFSKIGNKSSGMF